VASAASAVLEPFFAGQAASAAWVAAGADSVAGAAELAGLAELVAVFAASAAGPVELVPAERGRRAAALAREQAAEGAPPAAAAQRRAWVRPAGAVVPVRVAEAASLV